MPQSLCLCLGQRSAQPECVLTQPFPLGYAFEVRIERLGDD